MRQALDHDIEEVHCPPHQQLNSTAHRHLHKKHCCFGVAVLHCHAHKQVKRRAREAKEDIADAIQNLGMTEEAAHAARDAFDAADLRGRNGLNRTDIMVMLRTLDDSADEEDIAKLVDIKVSAYTIAIWQFI